MRWIYAMVCLFVPLALAAQAKPEETATLSGTVTNAVTGEPLRRAAIAMRRITNTRNSTTIQVTQSAYTDAAGKFTLTGIAAGEYRLSAERTGFLSQGYGARTPGGSGVLMTVAAGQKMEDMSLKLMPHGVITGRVVDEDGEPAVNANVQVSRQQYVNGVKQLTNASSTNTNDLGEYRAFGLKPGRYYVGATLRGTPVVGEPEDRYVTTFFPRTTDPAASTPVEVAAGTQVRNIDVTLRRLPTVSVRGRVVVEGRPGSGEATPRPGVVLAPSIRGSVQTATTSASVTPQGTFEIKGVTPGAYTLTAMMNSPGKVLSTRIPVQVGSGDVDGLVVTIGGGVLVVLRVKVEGDAPTDLKRIGIGLSLQEVSGIQLGPLPQLKRKEDGSFQAEDVSSEHFRVAVTGLPEGYYVKSIRSGETDVLVDGLNIAGVPPAPVEVLLSPRAALVAGVVLEGKSDKPAPGATVVLVPQDKKRSARAEYYKNVTTDAAGRFTFKDVPPGEYRAYVWEDVETGAWMDPDFLKAYEGEKVTLEDSGRASLQLKLKVVE